VGIEILAAVFVFLVFLGGFFGSVVLFGLSLTASSRPYALAVLLAACAFALVLNTRISHAENDLWGSVFVLYSLGIIVFGPLAYAITRCVKWHQKRSAS
jgi:hypothetical protein